MGGGEGGRVGDGVGEAVVDRGDAGGGGVAQEADLERGEARGQEREAVERGVAGEVDEEVGGVVADQRGEAGIGGVSCRASGRRGAEVGGDRVGGGVAEAENFEGGAVVIFQERFDETGDSVVAEIGER